MRKRVTPTCRVTSVCAPDEQSSYLDLDAGILTDGSTVDDAGWIQPPGAGVTGAPTYLARAAWFAGEIGCVVSKVDLVSRKEVGRYPCVLQNPTPNTLEPNPGGLALGTDWDADFEHRPSRTAIDQNFDAYVANRDTETATLSKIRNDSILRNGDGDPVDALGAPIPPSGNAVVLCPDRDGDGVARTSWDANYDGVINPADPQEFPGQKDDCVLWSSRPEGGIHTNNASNYRTMVVGLPKGDEDVGSPWVFSEASNHGHRLDKDTGTSTLYVPPAEFSGSGSPFDGFKPYGGATGPDGRIWLVDRSLPPEGAGPTRNLPGIGVVATGSRPLAWVDPVTGAVHFVSSPPSRLSPYGIAIDGNGSIWLSYRWVWGTTQPPGLARYSPSTDTWTLFPFPTIRTPANGWGSWDTLTPDPMSPGDWVYYDTAAARDREWYNLPKGIGVSFTDVWFGSHGFQEVLDYQAATAAEVAGIYTPGRRLFGKFSFATEQYTLYSTPTIYGSYWKHIGLAYSPLGDVWINGNANVLGAPAGAAWVFDPNTETFKDMAGVPGQKAIGATNERYYTYSDNIGFGLNELAGDGPTTSLLMQFEGCTPASALNTTWEALIYQLDTPGDSRVELRARGALNAGEFTSDSPTWSGPHSGGGPMNLAAISELQRKGHVQVEIAFFVSSSGELPKVRAIAADVVCSPIE